VNPEREPTNPGTVVGQAGTADHGGEGRARESDEAGSCAR